MGPDGANDRSSASTGSHRLAAIVLCAAVTGLATVRALAEAGVEVHAFVFSRGDPLMASRYGVKVELIDMAADEPRLVGKIHDYAAALGCRPVLIPTGDAFALMIARYREQLAPVCRIWSTRYDDLHAIVCKDRLYRMATELGVPILPSIATSDAGEIEAWSGHHPGPYLLKPQYEAIGDSSVQQKNQVVADATALRAYVQAHGANNMVVQRMVWGGDGEIYDSYGLCDRHGRIVCMASHRRLRQYPPDFGSTCHGEIPSGLGEGDAVLFDHTRRLLSRGSFHGIFGIEWLRDRHTGQFYLIDFNARPFSSIGHLHDCGLNLPWLACAELVGKDLSNVPALPILQQRLWVDFRRDLSARRTGRGSFRLPTWAWLRSYLGNTSFAYWRWRDPGPALWQIGRMLSARVGRAARALPPIPMPVFDRAQHIGWQASDHAALMAAPPPAITRDDQVGRRR